MLPQVSEGDLTLNPDAYELMRVRRRRAREPFPYRTDTHYWLSAQDPVSGDVRPRCIQLRVLHHLRLFLSVTGWQERRFLNGAAPRGTADDVR